MSIEGAPCLFPASLQQALEWMADEATRGEVLAGSTDLRVQWEAGVRPVPERVISIKHLPELHGMAEVGDEMHIGAAVTHWELRHSERVRALLPSLAAAAATVGGRQIQTMGTIAGNVANASPAGDLAPSLMVTNGHVEVASLRGVRTVPLVSLWTGYRQIDLQPDELIVRFCLPVCPSGHREYWRKLGPRRAQAISKIMGSCRGRVEGRKVKSFKVALGSVAPTALRLTAVEDWLEGQVVDSTLLEELEERVASEVQPISDIRSTADYRQWVAGRMVRDFVERLAAEDESAA